MNYHGIIGGADSFTIIGSSGLGKSSAISRAIRIISDTCIDYNNTKICPFVIAQCPYDSSVKGLVLEILRKMDLALETHYCLNAIRSHATTDVLIGVISQVAINHIGLLIIDEVQHCANSKNGKAFIRAITQLINNSGISICMVGTPECTVFFVQEMQLARRSMGLSYCPLEFDDYFVDLCKKLFMYQYTLHRNNLSEGLLEWLYSHSGGLVSLLVSLIHDAQEIAILNGTEKLELKSLNEAYEKRSAMMHGFIKGRIVSLPKTSKSPKENIRISVKNKDVQSNGQKENEYVGMDFSIAEIVEQCKMNDYDIIEILKQYGIIDDNYCEEQK